MSDLVSLDKMIEFINADLKKCIDGGVNFGLALLLSAYTEFFGHLLTGLSGWGSSGKSYNAHARIKGEFDQALEMYQKSLKIFQNVGDRRGVALTLGQIGNVQKSKGQYDQALEMYQKSLKIFNKLGDQSSIASSLQNIGILVELNGEFDQALEMYQKSLDIFSKLGDQSGVDRVKLLKFLLEDKNL